MFINCNSLVPENIYELQFTGAWKNTLSIWTSRWYMWWRSMSTLSFQWTSPGYWQKHSDVWSSLIRVISLSHAKNKITWIISMFLNLQSLSYWCCSDFRLIPMTANFASPRSLSTITRWLFQIFITSVKWYNYFLYIIRLIIGMTKESEYDLYPNHMYVLVLNDFI